MASANVGDCLSGAWGIFKNNAITHVVCTLLVMVVASISAGLLAGPMVVGYMRMIEREARGEAVQIGDIFRGFDDFVPAFVAGLISSLVVSLGFMLCFIPGLLVMALPPVALFLVARGERDGVAAFNQAWSIVTKNLGSAFFCSLVLGIVGSLGFLLCGVGALLTLPLSTIGSYYMARQLVGDEPVALPPSDPGPVVVPVSRSPAWQPLDGNARRLRLAFGLGWPLAMAATPWWLGQGGLGLGCGFRALTGMPCPLCGGTHACAALVQGDWAAAWAANPGAVLLLVWLVLLAGQAVVEGTLGHRRTVRWPWWHPAVLVAVGGGLLLPWLLRLAGLA